MKSQFFLLTTFLLFAGCNLPANKNQSTKITPEEIQIAKQLIQGSFDDLWGGMDSTKILNYHTKDFYILENGEVWTNQEIKDFMKKNLKNGNNTNRENKMDYLTIEKYGTAINIAYNNHATFSRNDSILGKGQWLESALAIPTNDGWRLRMMHSTWVAERAE